MCLLCGFFSTNSNAQFPSGKRFYPSIESTINRDTSFSQKNDLCLSTMKRLTLTEVPNRVFLSPGGNYDKLLNITTLSGDNGFSISGKSPLTVSDNFVTFSGKWMSLTGTPIIDKKVYYSPLKITNSPGIYNSQLYRTGANVFNMIVSAKYPYYPRK